MSVIQKIKTTWKNRNKITEGIWNSWFPNAYIEKIAKERAKICESNVCGFYDEFGTMEATYLKGQSACGGCGCNKNYKIHSLSSYCYLKDIGQQPLWEAVMTEQQEEAFRNKTKIKNE